MAGSSLHRAVLLPKLRRIALELLPREHLLVPEGFELLLLALEAVLELVPLLLEKAEPRPLVLFPCRDRLGLGTELVEPVVGSGLGLALLKVLDLRMQA